VQDITQTAFRISEYFSGFLSGVVSSSLVGYVIYKVQNRQAEKNNRDMILILYRIIIEGRESNDVLHEILQKIEGNTPSQKLKYISGEFNKSIHKLESGSKSKSQYVETVLNYKALADAYANISASTSPFDILASDGTITLERVISSHKKMFPHGYIWAGKLRTEIVEITGAFSARGRSLNAALSSIQVAVSRPENIIAELDIILSDWNYAVKNQLKKRDELAIAEELAHFHQQFLLIHPFLDGNGRVARAILREQVKFLFGKNRTFEFGFSEYYEALHLADLRQMLPLAEIILKEIRNDFSLQQ
jgi:fido (protein-threonine AMPylation protein)